MRNANDSNRRFCRRLSNAIESTTVCFVFVQPDK